MEQPGLKPGSTGNAYNTGGGFACCTTTPAPFYLFLLMNLKICMTVEGLIMAPLNKESDKQKPGRPQSREHWAGAQGFLPLPACHSPPRPLLCSLLLLSLFLALGMTWLAPFALKYKSWCLGQHSPVMTRPCTSLTPASSQHSSPSPTHGVWNVPL